MSTQDPPPVALTIAGSDSGGGAGIQADLKTFHQLRVYGTSAITMITAQNTTGVAAAETLPAAWVTGQIAAVAGDFPVAAAKTGVLGNAEVVGAVAEAIAAHRLAPVVCDPVMVSTSGTPLLDAGARQALIRNLLPKITLITPNLVEAAMLTGRRVETRADLEDAARALRDLGAPAVLLKGGHLVDGELVDLLRDGEGSMALPARRIPTRHTHGTGCTYSAAIAALLARGQGLRSAVESAKAFLHRAIATAPGLGAGNGPVNHWADMPPVHVDGP